MFSKLKKAGVVTAVLFGIGMAGNAAAAVTTWAYTLDSGFASYAPGTVTGSSTNVLLNEPTKLSWGTSTGFGQSSLSVGSATLGHLTGSLTTDAAAVTTVQVIHTNNPITGASLTSAVLQDRLQLQATSPAGPVTTLPDLMFNIHFLETTNATPCVVTTSPTPCNDIFVIDVAAAGFNPADNSFNQNFSYQGDNYNAKIFLTGLGILTNADCAAVGVANGCTGFTTVENMVNTFTASLQISSTQFFVPEPGLPALLGLGLFAMLAIGRRRQGS